MNDYLAVSNQRLEEIVIMVRGQLSKMARITLEALIVIDVHCKTFMEKLTLPVPGQNVDFSIQVLPNIL